MSRTTVGAGHDAGVDVPIDSVRPYLEALEEPAAVVDAALTRLCWTSGHWNEQLPHLPSGCLWPVCVEHSEALSSAMQAAIKSPEGGVEYDWPGGRPGDTLKISRVSDHGWLLRILPAPDIAKPLQRYLRSRDGLFSTSRTISVSEMATTLAHEINQPVGTIVNLMRGLQARLQRNALTLDDLESPLRQALEQAEFTASVISRIRDFTDARRPRRNHIELHALLHQAIGLLDWLLETHACRVSWQLGDGDMPVVGDETMLQQVILNVVRNAAEAMDEQPAAEREILVASQHRNGKVRISISDAGHGLSGDDALFVPFATEKPDGMGVGLSICRSFIELHQGRLWLAPNDRGGCTATVELPLMEHKEPSS